ncbi:MAG: DJ-1/PfpI family protein [Micrococcales bacterium]|nr:DJ-1/PfpI family protein [Micrococcales bacterium]
MATARVLRIGILCFDDVDELDLVGTHEVLTTWAERSPLRPEVITFSADGAGVRCAHGLRLLPDTSADDVGVLHVLIWPGGPGTRALATDPLHLAWARTMRERTPLLAAVSTGVLALAAAGLLAGRPATTRRDAFDELVGYDPTVLADTEARFVDDGDTVTSGAGSAGMDMALHLVSRLENLEAATQVRFRLQHDPVPT